MKLKHAQIAFVIVTAVAVVSIAYKLHSDRPAALPAEIKKTEKTTPAKDTQPQGEVLTGSEQHVTIHSETVITSFEPEIQFQEEEIDLMARVVQAEYGNGDETDMRLIVSVILNRLEDPDFPGTIYGVVSQPNQFAISQWASVECFSAVYKEVKERTDYRVLWFRAGEYPKWGTPLFERNNHYFSGKGE